MSVARHTEISATGPTMEEAIAQGVDRANKTLKNVTQAWVKEITLKSRTAGFQNTAWI